MNTYIWSRKNKLLMVLLAGLLVFSLFGTILSSPVESLSTPAASVGTSLASYEPGILDTCVIKESSSSYKMWFSHLKGIGSLNSLLGDLKNIVTDNLVTAIINRDPTALLSELQNIDAAALYSFLVNLQPVIGYATSTDGLNWTVVNDNVLSGGNGGAFDFAGTPHVVKTGGSPAYIMYYARTTQNVNQANVWQLLSNLSGNTTSKQTAVNNLSSYTATAIAFATSSDGISWTVQNPTLIRHQTSSGNYLPVFGPAYANPGDGNTYLYYTEVVGEVSQAKLTTLLSGLGTTLTATEWNALTGFSTRIRRYNIGTTADTVCLTGTTTDLFDSVANPVVITHNGSYEMFFQRGTSDLTQSAAANALSQVTNFGINDIWTDLKNGSYNNVLTKSVNLVDSNASFSTAANTFSNTRTTIGYATSSDGVNWTLVNGAAISGNSNAIWSSVGAPTAIYDNTTYTYQIWHSRGIDSLTAQNLLDFIRGQIMPVAYTTASDTVAAITVTPAGATIRKGDSRQYSAVATYVSGATRNVTALATWASSNTAVAAVSTTGNVTTPAQGTATISATFGGQTGSTTVTVGPPRLTALSVTPLNPSVALGLKKQFTATGTYSDTTQQNLSTSVDWASGTPGVATVNGSGVATSVGIGTTTITANITNADGAFSNSQTLTVGSPNLLSIAVAPTSATIAAGNTQAFTATGNYTDGVQRNITSTGNATWASSNTAVASVSTSGVATGLTTGTTKISASAGTVSSNDATLTVGAATYSSITVTPTNPTLRIGDTQQFRAVATKSDGSVIDVTTTANWTSSDTGKATIGLHTGLATPVGAGATTVNASLTTYGGVLNTSQTLTVTGAYYMGLTITPAASSVTAGLTKQFVATANLSDGNTAVVTDRVTSWTSSNTGNATINGAGLATGRATGTTTITAKFAAATGGAENVTGSTTLTVTAATLASITVTPDSPTLTHVSGNAPTLQFKATGVKTDGTTQDLTTTASWASTNATKASIVAGPSATGGKATTVAAGTTAIQATSGGKTGQTILTVLADTVAPVVTLSRPAAYLETPNTSVTINGTVDDVNSTLTYSLNGGAWTALTNSSGSFTKSVTGLNTNQTNTIQVRAVDGVGNTGLSRTANVYVNPNKPDIVITAPDEGYRTKTASVNVTGTVSGGVTSASLILNGSSQTITVTSGAFNQAVTLAAGENIIVVQAYASGHAGDSAYLGTSGVRKVTLDQTAPVVTLTSPSNGAVTNNATAQVSGGVDDPGTTVVRILHGTTPYAATVVNGAFNLQITMANGSNTFAVTANDSLGNTSTAVSRTVTLDTSKPGVTLTSPTDGKLTNVSSQVVSGKVDDHSITTATVKLGTTSYTVAVAPDGSFSKTVTLSSGANTISASATDASSNTGTSGTRTVTLDNTSPQLTIDLSDPTQSVTIMVASDEALQAAPTVTVNPTITMTQTDVNKWSGVYGSSGSPISAGQYVVRATGTDKAGNTGTANATFTKQSISTDGTNPSTVESASTTVKVTTNTSVSNASITVSQTTQNPSGNVEKPSGSTTGGVYLNIQVDPAIRDNLKEVYIEVKYDPAKLPSGTNEADLKLYLWNETNGSWDLVSGSKSDTTRKVIYGTVTHLSTYGGFASTTTTTTTPPSAGGGGAAPTATNPVRYSGLVAISKLEINASGVVQATAQVKTIDGRATLDFPQGTVMLLNGVASDYLSASNVAVPYPAPEGGAVITAYNFGPAGMTFNPGITLTINYLESALPAGVNEAELKIGYWDGAKWVLLDSTADAAGNKVSATITHFSQYGVIWAPSVTPPTTPTTTPPTETTPPTTPTTTPPTETTPPTTPTTTPTTPTTPPVLPPESQVNWYLVGGLIGAVVIIGGGLGFWAYRRRRVA